MMSSTLNKSVNSLSVPSRFKTNIVDLHRAVEMVYDSNSNTKKEPLKNKIFI